MSSMNLSVRLSGNWAGTISALRSPNVAAALNTAVTQAARQGVQRMAQGAPRRTGRLAAGYQAEPLGDGEASIEAVSYEPYVRLGTRRMRGNPALQQIMGRDIPQLA